MNGSVGQAFSSVFAKLTTELGTTSTQINAKKACIDRTSRSLSRCPM